jgi:hypothetical protein
VLANVSDRVVALLPKTRENRKPELKKDYMALDQLVSLGTKLKTPQIFRTSLGLTLNASLS